MNLIKYIDPTKILFRRYVIVHHLTPNSALTETSVFDSNLLSVMALLDNQTGMTNILVRTNDGNQPRYFIRGVATLVIKRRDSSLELGRWDARNGRSVPWVVLGFITWEGQSVTATA